MIKIVYNLLVLPLMTAGYWLYALADEKARDYFRMRKHMFEKLERGLSDLPGKGAPLVLFHAASVGELLQAMPLLAAMKDEPDPPLVVMSYTSPSVEKNFPKGVKADLVTPSPHDTKRSVRQFLDMLAPDLVVFSTYDVWPNMMLEAQARGVPSILVNATLPENSGRLKIPARWFFKKIYPRLQAIGAITEQDGKRFALLNVSSARIFVTGNCRFDQTLERCRAVSPDDPDVSILPDAEIMLVAGSTWPEDHAHLLPAVSGLLAKHPGLLAVIAPHEPNEAHVSEIENFFKGPQTGTIRYTQLREGVDPGAARVVVVDTVGVLYKLYKKGDMAYVGGSFKQGVHSVMEPAGMNLPVIVGPVHKNSAEALAMLKTGGAFSAKNAQEIENVIEKWVTDEKVRKRAGSAAFSVVENSAGATSRTMDLVKKHLG